MQDMTFQKNDYHNSSKISQKSVYLDYAAATPLDPQVFEEMKPYFFEKFYNPSAIYLPAKQIKEEYEAQKAKLAHSIGAKSPDLIITAGATESINLAFTILQNYQDSHCLILQTEHIAVKESAKFFSNQNYTEIAVDQFGVINLIDLKSKIRDNTILVSVALANNELGTIQPLSEISRLLQEIRLERLRNRNFYPLYLHSDASQAMNLIDLSVARLGVDLLTINSAKVYGPKGIGALFVSRGIKLSPIIYGGGQEMGLRSGTENVPLLVGFAQATEKNKAHISSNRKKYQELSRIFRQEVNHLSNIPPLWLGNPKQQLANFVPVCFRGLDAERLIYKLETQGVFLSTGAACAASKGQKSHILSAIGLSDEEISGSLRISLGRDNNEENVVFAARKISEIVNQEADRLSI